jgi:hypothetical protein
VYAECDTRADLFLTSLNDYAKKYGTRGEKLIEGWRMTDKHRNEYGADSEVRHIRIDFKADNWWNDKAWGAAR